MAITGVIGLILLAFGWASEAVELIRKKKSRIDPKFGVLYSVGTAFLVLHSVQIKDTIFIILNAVVLFLSVLSLWYSMKKK